MSNFIIESTPTTPAIKFDTDEGLLEMKRRSSPQNSVLFYKEILDKLDEFSSSQQQSITANMSFEYFNTSSFKCLFDILKKLHHTHTAGKDLVINWYFEVGDDIMEAGEDYSELLDIDINFCEIEED